MKNTLKTLTLALAAGLLASSSLFAQFNPTGTTTLSVNVIAESAIRIDTVGNTVLTNGASTSFGGAFVGTTNFTFKLRTLKALGTGTITVQAGGPLTSGLDTIAANLVTYTSTAGVGTPQSGTLSTGPATNLTTFGANIHSATAGTTGSVTWTLPDDPAYVTGTYTSTVTFTISAA
jgi:hypothetical protein